MPAAGSSSARSRARDLEPPLVAVRKMLREVVAAVEDADVFEKLPRALVDRLLLRARARIAQDRADHARLRAHVPPDHHVLERGEIREEADVLEGARDAERRDAVGRRVHEPLSLEEEAPLILAIEAREDVEERGLSRAVGPDEPVDLALADREAHAGKRDEAAEALGDVLDLEEGLACMTSTHRIAPV
jgi:hypothetical protein